LALVLTDVLPERVAETSRADHVQDATIPERIVVCDKTRPENRKKKAISSIHCHQSLTRLMVHVNHALLNGSKSYALGIQKVLEVGFEGPGVTMIPTCTMQCHVQGIHPQHF
jgi:hypothetical protein